MRVRYRVGFGGTSVLRTKVHNDRNDCHHGFFGASLGAKFHCDRCSKSFSQLVYLRTHQKVVHEGALLRIASLVWSLQ